ncbi:MAG: YceI family protein [Methylocella sp.]
MLAAAASIAALAGAAAAKPQAYAFDKTHTTIRASWNHWGYSRQSLDFTKYDGTLLLDFDKPKKSKVEVIFSPADGFWAGAPDSDRFEKHLSSPDFFDIAKFPAATFKATSFDTADGVAGTMTGDLTIKDQTHPVTLNVKLNQKGEVGGKARAGFSATTTIDRTLWGMGYGAPGIPAEIDITIETELVGPEMKAKQ